MSIDGLQPAHDAIRQRGSYRSALATLDIAQRHGIAAGVTTTVTATNVSDIPQLAQVVAQHGASELKLHQLRMVGNALRAPQLAATTTGQLSGLMDWLRRPAEHPLTAIFDDDLDPDKPGVLSGVDIGVDDPFGGVGDVAQVLGGRVMAMSFASCSRMVSWMVRTGGGAVVRERG